MSIVQLNIEHVDAKALTKSQAQERLSALLAALNTATSELESAIVDVALEHQLDVSLGDYGSGRSLILEDDHWSGKDRGEWVYSSETC